MIPKNKNIFSVPLRGTRNYNWGPDIGKLILESESERFNGQLKDIYLKINRFSKKNIKVLTSSEGIQSSSNSPLLGTIQYKYNDQTLKKFLYEEGHHVEKEIIQFDEEYYLNKHLIKRFKNKIQVNYSNHPLAILSCANKDLLRSIFNFQDWIFASLRINYYPIQKLPFLLKYKYSLEDKIFITDFFQDNIKTGQIVFVKKTRT